MKSSRVNPCKALAAHPRGATRFHATQPLLFADQLRLVPFSLCHSVGAGSEGSLLVIISFCVVITDSLMLAQTLLPTCLPYASAVAAPVAALLRHLLALLARALRTATGRRRGAASPRKSTPDSSPQPAPAPICGLSPVGMDAKGGRWSVEGREERNAHAHGALDRKAGSPARARSPDSGVRSRFHRNRAPPGAPLHLQAWPVERNLFASDNDPGSPTSGRGLSPDVDVGKGLRIGRRKVEHQGGSRGGQEKGALGHRGGIAADRMAGKSGERAPGGGQAGEGLGERSGADEKAMGRGRGWQGPAANTRRGRGRSGATELEGRAGRVRGKEEEEKEEEEIVRREVSWPTLCRQIKKIALLFTCGMR